MRSFRRPSPLLYSLWGKAALHQTSASFFDVASVAGADYWDKMGRSLSGGSSSPAELLDSDTVHIHGALLGQALAHGDAAALIRLVLGLADKAGLLELFEAVADVLSSGLLGDFLLGTAAGLATVVLAKSLHSNLLSHVELVANRSCAGIEPIIVQGVQLLIAGSLNGLGPLLNIILIRTGLRKESKKLIAHIWA